MAIRGYKPYTPGRHMTSSDFQKSKTTPEKSLVTSINKKAGRNNQGKITVNIVGGAKNIELLILKEGKMMFDKSCKHRI